MREHLVFTLSATIGATGEIAGHTRRSSLGWPGRSAIEGILGAALGLKRDSDFSLIETMQTAVAIFDEGEPLRDYHTAQTVPSAAMQAPQTRAEALTAGKSQTVITIRDYRTGPLFGVAVWNTELEVLREALRRPSYVLYLGRKSCPLSAPAAPRLVVAPEAASALRSVVLPPWRRGARAQVMVGDDGAGAKLIRREQRWDVSVDRARDRWHFAPREVSVWAVDIVPEAVAA